MNYKQGIQCWVQTLAGIRSTSAQRAKKVLGTLSSQKYPAIYPTLHSKVPCGKVPTTAIHRIMHRSKTRCSTTPHTALMLSTRTAIPIRRNVTTAFKTATQTIVPARVPVPRSRAQFASMRNVQAQNCADPFKPQRANCTAPTGHTHERAHMNESTIPLTTFQIQCPFARQAVPFLHDMLVAQSGAKRTNVRSRTLLGQRNNWLQNQLTCLGLVPRIHTSPRSVVPSPRREAVPFTPVNAHSRLPLALWVGHRAASRCRRLQGSLLLHGVCRIVGRRARYEHVERFGNPMSTRHAADATRDTQLEENRNSQMQKEQ